MSAVLMIAAGWAAIDVAIVVGLVVVARRGRAARARARRPVGRG